MQNSSEEQCLPTWLICQQGEVSCHSSDVKGIASQLAGDPAGTGALAQLWRWQWNTKTLLTASVQISLWTVLIMRQRLEHQGWWEKQHLQEESAGLDSTASKLHTNEDTALWSAELKILTKRLISDRARLHLPTPVGSSGNTEAPCVHQHLKKKMP